MWPNLVNRVDNRMVAKKLLVGFNNINNQPIHNKAMSIYKIMNDIYLQVLGDPLAKS
jgi:hypothetical protein